MKVIIDGADYVAKRSKIKNPIAIINGREYKRFGWGYTDRPKQKFKVLILWSDGSIMIYKDMMTLDEIHETDWQMGTQAFPILRDLHEEANQKEK